MIRSILDSDKMLIKLHNYIVYYHRRWWEMTCAGVLVDYADDKHPFDAHNVIFFLKIWCNALYLLHK